MSVFHKTEAIGSWGRVQTGHHWAAVPYWRDEIPSLLNEKSQSQATVLAMGKGRSYGDSGLNVSGRIVSMTRLNRLIAFDPVTGLLRAESGLSLADLIAFSVPRGFYPPVVPGTSHVMLGGMVANDVHGKNHHAAGTIGRWVTAIELVRSVTEGKTLIMVEHDMGVVMDISDRVVVLDRGQRISAGTPEEVQRDPAVIRAYLGTTRAGAAA